MSFAALISSWYYIYGVSVPSLLIESTDSMIHVTVADSGIILFSHMRVFIYKFVLAFLMI